MPGHGALPPAGSGRQKGMVPMSRITVSSVARLGTGVVCLAVALCLTAPCQAQDFKQIDKSTIVVADSFPSYPAGGDWTAGNVLDSSSFDNFPAFMTNNQYFTDYASSGGGTNTYIVFDFGQQYTFAAIRYTDRTTSGGGNGTPYFGSFDFNTSYSYTFSNDPTFSTSVGQVVVNTTPPFVDRTLRTVDMFETLSIISGIPPCQYIKWQVVASNGSNPGASDFAFYGQ